MAVTYHTLEAWNDLTLTNSVIQGSYTAAGSANIRARQWVHVEEEFHAQLGSEVHIYTDKTWPDCNSEGYASQFAPDPEQMTIQPGQIKRVDLGLELHFQQPALSVAAFPNPCTDQLTIALNSNGGMCILYDLYGQLVRQASFATTSCILPTTELAAGPYLLRVSTSLGVWTTLVNKLP
jgi:hypothetical protein